MLAAPVVSREALRAQVSDLIADRAFFLRGEKIPRDKAAFELRLKDSAERIGLATQDIAKLLPKIFDAYQAARLAVEQCTSPTWDHARRDAQLQLDALLAEGFLLSAPWMWSEPHERFSRAIRSTNASSSGSTRGRPG